MPRHYWLLLCVGVVLSATGAIVLKIGAMEVDYARGLSAAIGQVASNWKIGLGLLLYFIPALIWIFMLKRVEVSLLQPLFSLVYVLTPVLAAVFLHESVSWVRWLGIALVITGVVVIGHG